MKDVNFNERFWEKAEHPQNTAVHTTQEERDIFYLKVAKLVSTRSKCASRQIGAVLVKDDNILSWGCNGAPPGIDLCQDVHSICPRQEAGYGSGKGLHLCPAQHAERNAILHAAKEGIATNGATLYCYCGLPCMECWKAIICAGISRVVYIKPAVGNIVKNGTGDLVALDKGGHLIKYDNLSMVLADKSGVIIDTYAEDEID